MTKKELKNKGYVYMCECYTKQQAKERAAIMRQNGFYATVHTITKKGVPYYVIFGKRNTSLFAVWGGNVSRENAITIMARSCDHALDIARAEYNEAFTTVKRL